MGSKCAISSDFWFVSNIFQVFLQLYVFTSEMAVVKSCHSISVKCYQYHDIGAADPSLENRINWLLYSFYHKKQPLGINSLANVLSRSQWNIVTGYTKLNGR